MDIPRGVVKKVNYVEEKNDFFKKVNHRWHISRARIWFCRSLTWAAWHHSSVISWAPFLLWSTGGQSQSQIELGTLPTVRQTFLIKFTPRVGLESSINPTCTCLDYGEIPKSRTARPWKLCTEGSRADRQVPGERADHCGILTWNQVAEILILRVPRGNELYGMPWFRAQSWYLSRQSQLGAAVSRCVDPPSLFSLAVSPASPGPSACLSASSW